MDAIKLILIYYPILATANFENQLTAQEMRLASEAPIVEGQEREREEKGWKKILCQF